MDLEHILVIVLFSALLGACAYIIISNLVELMREDDNHVKIQYSIMIRKNKEEYDLVIREGLDSWEDFIYDELYEFLILHKIDLMDDGQES